MSRFPWESLNGAGGAFRLYKRGALTDAGNMDASEDFLHARYEVRRPDGSEFGPVSAWTLAEWREAGRVFDTDEIRRINGESDRAWVVLRDSEFLRRLPDEPLGWNEEG